VDDPLRGLDIEAVVEPTADQTDTLPPPETISRLVDDLLPALIARLDASGLGELEVRTDRWRIRLRKPYERRHSLPLPEGRRRRGGAFEAEHAGNVDTRGAGPDNSQHGELGRADTDRGTLVDRSHATRIGHSGRRSGGRPDAGSAGVGVDVGGDLDASANLASPADLSVPAIATSPAVGYFTPREGWTTGHQVLSGDVVGYVDCLGVRQDVVAPADGFVGRLLARAGEAVEYGQPLVHVDLPLPGPAASASPNETPTTRPEGT
jgi:biotin carboxyl carrier protein